MTKFEIGFGITPESKVNYEVFRNVVSIVDEITVKDRYYINMVHIFPDGRLVSMPTAIFKCEGDDDICEIFMKNFEVGTYGLIRHGW